MIDLVRFVKGSAKSASRVGKFGFSSEVGSVRAARSISIEFKDRKIDVEYGGWIAGV